ncbi:type VI immunity family protein [Loktanella sp. F6476L]|uniref:type VI immunity family protein n=1 Tax=Loktanella sp. F6476L TaxID=2926405 RepID=UPI0032B21FEE
MSEITILPQLLDYENGGWVTAHLLKYWPEHVWFLPRIKRVNWLTFVRNQMLDELCGGTDQVVQALQGDDGIICHDLGDGKIIQAGAAPAIGDVTTGDILPAYRRVAKALAPARLPKVKSFGTIFGSDVTNGWLNALERDDD